MWNGSISISSVTQASQLFQLQADCFFVCKQKFIVSVLLPKASEIQKCVINNNYFDTILHEARMRKVLAKPKIQSYVALCEAALDEVVREELLLHKV